MQPHGMTQIVEMKDPVTKDVRMIPPVCEAEQAPDRIISPNV